MRTWYGEAVSSLFITLELFDMWACAFILVIQEHIQPSFQSWITTKRMCCPSVTRSHAQLRMFLRRLQIFLPDSDHITCTSASCSGQWKSPNTQLGNLIFCFCRISSWIMIASVLPLWLSRQAQCWSHWKYLALCTFFNANTCNVLLGFSREKKKFLFQTKMIKKIWITKRLSQEKKKSLQLLSSFYWNPTSCLISW